MAVAIRPADPREIALRGILARAAFERHLSDQTTAVLEAAFKEIVARLVTEYNDLTPRERARLASLFVQVNKQLAAAYGEVNGLTHAQLSAYAGVESEAAVHDLAALAGVAQIEAGGVVASTFVLARSTVQAIAALPIQGLSLGEWWQTQATTMAAATRRAIQTGLVQGESVRDIAARIVPPRGALDPAVWRQARAQATTIVRTSATAVHANAAMATYEQIGSDVSEEYELVAVRDNRTTPICRALDGKRYRYDDPDRREPPFHVNCRTSVIPVVNHAALGLTPPGPNSPLSFPSLADWLREQPQATQDEMLGRAGAALFRSGRASLEDLVAGDGRRLTIPELRRKFGLAA